MLANFLESKGIDTCNIEQVLFELYKKGLISTNYYYYREVYIFMKEILKTGRSKKDAVITTSQHFDISERNCYYIFKKMEKLEKGE